jgi:hypothetical protein
VAIYVLPARCWWTSSISKSTGLVSIVVRVVPPITLLAAGVIAFLGSAHAENSPTTQVRFVGCQSIGGADPGPRPAPQHGPESLPKEPAVGAAQIAFYKAVDGPGVFAPRGWHCQTWSGSSGSFIIVTPNVPPQIIPRKPVTGRGVIAIESYGGTSGRFDVAEVSARLFPVVMGDFVARVKAEAFPAPDFAKIRPYLDDQYIYLNPKLVEFTTPAHEKGIGTGIFVPSTNPVRGVVSLAAGDERETNLLQFELRLSPSDDRLAQALIDLQLQCLGSSWPSC